MPQFRSKPTIIEAEQFFEKTPLPFAEQRACCYENGEWYVTTAHGQKTIIVPGDWIVPEPDGRGFYPIKPDIFERKYEPVE